MQRPPQHIGAEPDRKRATLEYIVDLAQQLADMADGIGECDLADRLRRAAATMKLSPPH